MKTEVIGVEFSPIEIKLTLETQAELDFFCSFINHSKNSLTEYAKSGIYDRILDTSFDADNMPDFFPLFERLNQLNRNCQKY